MKGDVVLAEIDFDPIGRRGADDDRDTRRISVGMAIERDAVAALIVLVSEGNGTIFGEIGGSEGEGIGLGESIGNGAEGIGGYLSLNFGGKAEAVIDIVIGGAGKTGNAQVILAAIEGMEAEGPLAATMAAVQVGGTTVGGGSVVQAGLPF